VYSWLIWFFFGSGLFALNSWYKYGKGKGVTGPSFGERQAQVKNSDVLLMEIHYREDPAFMFLFFNPSVNRQEVVGMELPFLKF